MTLLAELKRRHVYRVAVVYVVMAWLLLQVADVVLGILQVPDWVMKAVLGLLAIGLPVALVLAWAFELTPEGVRRTEPADSPQARAPDDTRHVARRLNLVLGAALVAALAFIGWDRLSRSGPADAAATDAVPIDATADRRKSIAVLPLANGSGDPAQEYFSDGLTEELIAGLSKVSGLKVIGRSSSFQFKDAKVAGTEIGRRLGVDHLLEGSVRQQGERVRIVVSLIHTDDGSTLWSQTFDRVLGDIFAMQSEIARAVAAALQVELSPATAANIRADQPPSGNVEAYQAYLQGRTHGRRNEEAGYRTSIEYHRKAIGLDPRYAAPYLGLTLSLINLGGLLPLEDTLALRREAKDSAAMAMRIAPDNIHAYLAQAAVLSLVDGDDRAAEAALRRALELGPNDPSALGFMGTILVGAGRSEEGIEYLQRAVGVDPLLLRWRANMVLPLMGVGRLDDAQAQAEYVLRVDAAYPGMHSLLADIAALRGDAAGVRKAAERDPDPTGRHYALALALAVDGDRGAFEAAVRKGLDECVGPALNCQYGAMSLYAFARQPDRMFEYLDRLAEDPRYLPDLSDPYLRPYWHDPRFVAHLAKYGMSTPSPVSQPVRAH